LGQGGSIKAAQHSAARYREQWHAAYQFDHRNCRNDLGVPPSGDLV
jgi:hypothetical protein